MNAIPSSRKYIVVIDGTSLTDPQHMRLLEEILRLGDGTREGVPPLPLVWNAVDAPFEVVQMLHREACDKIYTEEVSRFPRPVICAWCRNRHRSIEPPSNDRQGDACAASVFQVTEDVLSRMRDPHIARERPRLQLGEWLVQGHYGSSDYDCRLFRFVQNPPTRPADPICDNCVGEREVSGDLESVEGHYPW